MRRSRRDLCTPSRLQPTTQNRAAPTGLQIKCAAYPAFRFSPRWAILTPRPRRFAFGCSPAKRNPTVWNAGRAGAPPPRLRSGQALVRRLCEQGGEARGGPCLRVQSALLFGDYQAPAGVRSRAGKRRNGELRRQRTFGQIARRKVHPKISVTFRRLAGAARQATSRRAHIAKLEEKRRQRSGHLVLAGRTDHLGDEALLVGHLLLAVNTGQPVL